MVRLFGKKIGKDKDYVEPSRGLGGAGVPGPAADDIGAPGGDFPAIPSPIPAAAPSNEHMQTISRNIDLLSSKLDTLKASLDALNQRLANIEASLKQPAQPTREQSQQQQTSPYFPTASAEQQPSSTEETGWHY